MQSQFLCTFYRHQDHLEEREVGIELGLEAQAAVAALGDAHEPGVHVSISIATRLLVRKLSARVRVDVRLGAAFAAALLRLGRLVVLLGAFELADLDAVLRLRHDQAPRANSPK